MTDKWNPDRYEQFRHERMVPGYDLMGLLAPCPGGRVIDLGCGTGELTKLLHEGVQAAETVGIDSSEAMLFRCPHGSLPGLHFEQGDIRDFSGNNEWDLIFSNAALHWVQDHPSLIRRFWDALKSEGILAIQIPANHTHISHQLSAQVARETPFREALHDWVVEYPVLTPEMYATHLHETGFDQIQVYLKVYTHLLKSRDEIAEWYQGTLFTAYEKRLSAELFSQFVDRYLLKIQECFPDRRPFLFTFNRILLRGRKPARP